LPETDLFKGHKARAKALLNQTNKTADAPKRKYSTVSTKTFKPSPIRSSSRRVRGRKSSDPRGLTRQPLKAGDTDVARLATYVKNHIRSNTFGVIPTFSNFRTQVAGPGQESQLGQQSQSLGMGRRGFMREMAQMGTRLGRAGARPESQPGFGTRGAEKMNRGKPGKKSRSTIN